MIKKTISRAEENAYILVQRLREVEDLIEPSDLDDDITRLNFESIVTLLRIAQGMTDKIERKIK
jgi:hypothetical protein